MWKSGVAGLEWFAYGIIAVRECPLRVFAKLAGI
jgi:hypothetical protein